MIHDEVDRQRVRPPVLEVFDGRTTPQLSPGFPRQTLKVPPGDGKTRRARRLRHPLHARAGRCAVPDP
jgi:hypothetical protein